MDLSTMAPSLIHDEPIPSMHNIDVFRCVITATVACLIYDYILTLNDEKCLIWSSHLSITKVAFFINRYMPLLATIGMMHTLVILSASDHVYFQTCKLRFLIFSGFILVEFLVSSFIIYMRAYAVWGCKRSMLVLFSSAYIVLGALTLFFFYHFINSTTVEPRHPYHTGCVLGLHSCHVCAFSLIILVISESFAVVMILIKAVQMPGSSTMKRIKEDGVIYFLIVIAASIANIVILTKTPPSLCDFLLASQSALQSICCNHLFFRIRELGSSPPSNPISGRSILLHSSTHTPASTTSNDIELVSSDTWDGRYSNHKQSNVESA